MSEPITNNSFTENHVANVPAHLCTAFVKDGKFYAGSVDVPNPTNGGNYIIHVSESTPEAFHTLIKSLP